MKLGTDIYNLLLPLKLVSSLVYIIDYLNQLLNFHKLDMRHIFTKHAVAQIGRSFSLSSHTLTTYELEHLNSFFYSQFNQLYHQ